MAPGPDGSFWSHLPGWSWPIIIAGVLCAFLYEAAKASETVARVLGKLGKLIHENSGKRKMDKKLDRIEATLDRTSDKLDCAMAYLAVDAEWHQDADIVIAEHCPRVMVLLPGRIPFTEFARRWKDGDKPVFYDD